MSNDHQTPFAFLAPAVQNYAWGCKGKSSLVARMWKQSQEQVLSSHNTVIEEDKPYAELWYGAHPNGMNLIKKKGDQEAQPITEFIEQHQAYHERISPTIADKNDESAAALPYLLKVLCNDMALSIQCHPDKATAGRLFREQPTVYKDPNHKPEVSLALSESVEAMCGFRPWNEIADAINHVSEIAELLGSDWIGNHSKQLQDSTSLTSEEVAECLKATFKGFMKSDERLISICLNHLKQNSDNYLKKTEISETLKTSFKVFLKLIVEFPDDVGCLAPFLLNHVVTRPGECLFTRANVLHAYLQGQIIECMACSDNVVRGGLTPKFKDMDLLLDILDYSPYKAPLIIPQSLQVSSTPSSLPTPKVLLYDPQIGDFRLYLIYVPVGSNISTPLKFKGDSAAILTVLQGKADIKVDGVDGSSDTTGPIVQGHSLLLPLDSSLTISHSNTQPSPMTESTSSTASVIPPIHFNEMLEGKQGDVDFVAVVAIGGASTVTSVSR